jgi:type IV pilus assembly protein PilA
MAVNRLIRRDVRGFTLVELLVVMLILGILAAIGIAIFLNQRSKAFDSEAKTAAVTASKAMEIWQQDYGSYAAATPAGLTALEPTLAEARGLAVTGHAGGYTVSVDSAAGPAGGGTFVVTRTLTGTERTCANPAKGGCPAAGTW